MKVSKVKTSKRTGKSSGKINNIQNIYYYIKENGDKQNISEDTYIKFRFNPNTPKVYHTTIIHSNI